MGISMLDYTQLWNFNNIRRECEGGIPEVKWTILTSYKVTVIYERIRIHNNV